MAKREKSYAKIVLTLKYITEEGRYILWAEEGAGIFFYTCLQGPDKKPVRMATV